MVIEEIIVNDENKNYCDNDLEFVIKLISSEEIKAIGLYYR
jgi:hypothetical protein